MAANLTPDDKLAVVQCTGTGAAPDQTRLALAESGPLHGHLHRPLFQEEIDLCTT